MIKKLVILILALLLFFWFLTQIGLADDPFNHNVCKYPYRTTNPPNGCDNSDPCDTLSAVKGGSGDCEPVSQNIVLEEMAGK